MQKPTLSQQTHCKTFSNRARGSDPKRVWNATDRKCAPEMLLAEVFQKGPTEQHRHLNRNKNQEIHRNTLKNFILRSFNKNLPWFRCGGKEKHLNPASRLNQTANPLTTNALQDFQQLCPRFRSQTSLECHRLQMCLGGTSEKGIPERTNRTAQASESEQKPRNPPQFIE